MPPFFAKSLLPWDDKVMSMACTRKAWPSLSSCAKSRLVFPGRWPLRDDPDHSMVRWLWLVENQTSWGSKKNNHYDMYPSTSWDFFQFHSWIFFTRASLDLKTQKSHQRRDPSILRCLWFYPHINLWEVDTCLRRRSVVPLGATDGSIHWKGFFLRWRTWCWRKNGPNILQIVQVLSLFCWELKKWCVRKWCVYSIHTYCKYHICDMCIATAALVQPSLVW